MFVLGPTLTAAVTRYLWYIVTKCLWQNPPLCMIQLLLWRILNICLKQPKCMHPYLVQRWGAQRNLIVLPHLVRPPTPFGMSVVFLLLVCNFYIVLNSVYSFVPPGLSNDLLVKTTHSDTNLTWPPIQNVWGTNCPVLFVSVASGLRFFRQQQTVCITSIGLKKSWWPLSLVFDKVMSGHKFLSFLVVAAMIVPLELFRVFGGIKVCPHLIQFS